MIETWTTIKGFEAYKISTQERIKNSRGQLMATRISDWGVKTVSLYRDGKNFGLSVNKLMKNK